MPKEPKLSDNTQLPKESEVFSLSELTRTVYETNLLAIVAHPLNILFIKRLQLLTRQRSPPKRSQNPKRDLEHLLHSNPMKRT